MLWAVHEAIVARLRQRPTIHGLLVPKINFDIGGCLLSFQTKLTKDEGLLFPFQ